ncbi:hypothetical protein L6452_09444 [Arctium lappa]|uniref:Uncharacterized protein n=1 Tax=Arctium lappa TaxID=4217 RepID=A0ACB9DKD2_ARCLA|nr:hypothetical protein L6452_09444 [Arctium lappa]
MMGSFMNMQKVVIVFGGRGWRVSRSIADGLEKGSGFGLFLIKGLKGSGGVRGYESYFGDIGEIYNNFVKRDVKFVGEGCDIFNRGVSGIHG